MEKRIIKAERRLLNGKHSVKENRKLGTVPGVLYGNKVGNIAISISEKDFRNLGGSQLIEIMLSGGSYPAMVREVQKHPISGRISHVDLQQVDIDKKVKTVLAVRTAGEPAVLHAGGVLHLGERELEVEAYPENLPAFLEADISTFVVGQKYTIADLQQAYPKIKIISDPDSLVASIAQARAEEITEIEVQPEIEEGAATERGAETEKENE